MHYSHHTYHSRHSFPTRRSSDLSGDSANASSALQLLNTRIPDHDPDFVAEFIELFCPATARGAIEKSAARQRKKRSEEHTSELQSLTNLVCRLLLEQQKRTNLTQ